MATVEKALPEQSSALRSPWIWGWFALLSVMLVANAILVYFASTTSSGLVSEDFYERGQSFTERTKEEFLQKQAHDWSMTLDMPEVVRTGKATTFFMTITDESKKNVPVTEATVFLYRPSDAKADFSVSMESQGEGVFSAPVLFPLEGVWDIIVEGKFEGKTIHTAKRLKVIK